MLNNSKPSRITIYNLNSFFDFRSVSSGGIKAGMFVQFRYSSPAGVHDVKPLVYVIENLRDRIFGVNFHYDFGLMAQIIELKDEEVQKFLENNSDYQNYKKQLEDPDTEEMEEDALPDADEVKNNMQKKVDKIEPVKDFDMRKIRFPQNMLENYNNNEIKPSKEMLRNYLFNRMIGIQKLVYLI